MMLVAPVPVECPNCGGVIIVGVRGELDRLSLAGAVRLRLIADALEHQCPPPKQPEELAPAS